ncbi:MAG: CRISPR-associated protein Cas5 [Thermodesulfovibrio sp.]|nr:CRISPR-associated protein Cas5 [Thermodesulfovibrio sp.]MCX7724309.1 CRISPR-associated protein Cas5 [Thermodesulfovibrio sp.]
MKAIVARLRLNSLYSIRIPFTWQSSLTYPVLPPSAVIGLIANCIQRYKNDKHPTEYLEMIEEKIVWAGSRLLSPCIIKSFITSAIVKWEDEIGGKFTNALGRQFAYTKEIEIAAIFKDDTIINDVEFSLKYSPFTCGDSESISSLESIEIKNAEKVNMEEIDTFYPIPFNKDTQILSGKGQIFFMHERCKKTEEDFPLFSYLVPLTQKNKVLYPELIRVKVMKNTNEVFLIGDRTFVIKRVQTSKQNTVRKK